MPLIFRAVDADKFSVFVDFFAAEFCAVRYAQGDYTAAFHICRATEDFGCFRFLVRLVSQLC